MEEKIEQSLKSLALKNGVTSLTDCSVNVHFIENYKKGA